MASIELKEMSSNRKFVVLVALLSLVGYANSANAVTVFSGAGPVQPDENILYNATGLVSRGYDTITGKTNNTGFIVDVISKDSPKPTGDFELFTPSGGQSRVEGIDGNDDQVLFSSVEIIPNAAANPDFGFTEMEFNVNVKNGESGLLEMVIKGTGFSDITTTVDKDSNPMYLGNGSNFYSLVIMAGPTELIESVQLNVLDDTGTDPNLIVEDIRQWRISGRSSDDNGGGTGHSSTPEPSTPEPSTLILATLGFVGLVGTRRRRRR